MAEIVVSTVAAAEGLNSHFCGTLINHDILWNRVRVEQCIGRNDRLGQIRPGISIINLHYERAVEAQHGHTIRVTTGTQYYDQRPDSAELWSPGSPLFPVPEIIVKPEELVGMTWTDLIHGAKPPV